MFKKKYWAQKNFQFQFIYFGVILEISNSYNCIRGLFWLIQKIGTEIVFFQQKIKIKRNHMYIFAQI